MHTCNSWPAAVLFDCDGVLIDNESITESILQSWASERLRLVPQAAQHFAARCRGLPTASLLAFPETSSANVSGAELAALDAFIDQTVRNEARPMHGITDTVQRIPVLKAVVSNASADWLTHVVDKAGLQTAFGSRLFGA